MIDKINQYIVQEELLEPQKLVLVACSGGPDSMCLLHLLKEMGYPLVALHCNFHLRGDESNRDEQFVTQICQSWNIPLCVTHFDTLSYAQEHKVSIEMAARNLRYAWFEEMRQAKQAQAIAVAHHLNDNIETVLINLIRGTGIQGLTGMRPKNGYIVRPLLEVSRKEIEAYLEEHKIEAVLDSTNLETEFTRNKIRHEVWPLLQRINPSMEVIMSSNLKNFRSVNAIYQHYLEKQKKQWYRQIDHTIVINLTGVQQQEEPETLLSEWLRPFKIHPAEVHKFFTAETGKHFENSSYYLTIQRSDNHKSRLLIIRPR